MNLGVALAGLALAIHVDLFVLCSLAVYAVVAALEVERLFESYNNALDNYWSNFVYGLSLLVSFFGLS